MVQIDQSIRFSTGPTEFIWTWTLTIRENQMTSGNYWQNKLVKEQCVHSTALSRLRKEREITQDWFLFVSNECQSLGSFPRNLTSYMSTAALGPPGDLLSSARRTPCFRQSLLPWFPLSILCLCSPTRAVSEDRQHCLLCYDNKNTVMK